MYFKLIESSRAAKEEHNRNQKAAAVERRNKHREWNAANKKAKQ
jgi:hypothetical protein